MSAETLYEDRRDAGQQLAGALHERGVDADRVLGIPRGALPVARPVADALDRPLGVVVGRKMGHPEESDLAIGGVAADGTVWLDDDAINQWSIDDDYLEAEVERQRETVREKISRYADGDLPAVAGETVVVVDDGAARGATARVCVQHLREQDADRVVLAVPVASAFALDALDGVADEFVCPMEPSGNRPMWEYFEEFGQVTDDEAVAYLD
jgi:predicted phosphoribosyltransferase